jgi:hypothetical protein
MPWCLLRKKLPILDIRSSPFGYICSQRLSNRLTVRIDCNFYSVHEEITSIRLFRNNLI